MRAPLLFLVLSLPALAGEAVQVLSAVVKDQRIDGAEVIVQKNGAQSPGYSPLVTRCPCRELAGLPQPVSVQSPPRPAEHPSTPLDAGE